MANALTPRFFTTLKVAAFAAITALAACSGEMPVEKAIVGTWIQETPVSMSADRLQTTTSNTILTLKQNGEGSLSRTLNLQGAGLPEGGIDLNVDLRGRWELTSGQLVQTAETTLITPRTADALSVQWADALQKQSEEATASVKTIVAADKTQLILQDTDLGMTDVYRRK